MTSTARPWERPRSSGRGDGDPPQRPSAWISHPLGTPQPDNKASFVEYLRWMRVKCGNGNIDGGTTLELLRSFENNDFSVALRRLTDRTKRLADECFEATCPWRIRVGGAKGPESMLLPAFDALGMPYIPSSTLKGVARAIASLDASVTEADIKRIFGDINPNASMGQVIFLDAYPLPGGNKKGGLMPDMTNAIWKWEGTTPPQYNTNPNVFLSLKKPTFAIGLRRGAGCDGETFERVKEWLMKGLGYGIGGRVNTGYGALDVKGEKPKKKKRILSVKFSLSGQLIHGRQTFANWNPHHNGSWRPQVAAEAEVRPTAFRSTLRYWFRALALGVLPNQRVRDLEMEIFGGIEPEPHTGLFSLEVANETIRRDNARNQNDQFGLAEGTLILRNSSQTASLPEKKKQALSAVLENLSWLMFHLGGVGQGSRRPCYSRRNRPRAPWWRGATLIAESDDEFWQIPDNVTELRRTFRQRLQAFYTALEQFSEAARPINFRQPRAVLSPPTQQNWVEAVDSCCRIVCVTGNSSSLKPFALDVLHQVGHMGGGHYDRYLCGATAIPSPVWISELGDCQVATVFGVTENPPNPRSNYLSQLRQRTTPDTYSQIWPFA